MIQQKKRIAGKKGVFTKYFLMICIFMLLLMLLASFTNYYTTKRVLKEEVYRSNRDLVTHITNSIDSTIAMIDNAIYQVLSNPSLNTFISQKLNIRNYSNLVTINSLSNVLESISHVNELINGFRIYSVQNTMCVSESKISVLNDHEVENLRTYLHDIPMQKWLMPGERLPIEDGYDNIRFVYRLNSHYNNPSGLMVLELKNDVFFDFISRKVIRKTGYVAVIDEKDNILVDNGTLRGSSLYHQIIKGINSNEETDFFVNDGRDKYLVTYTVSKHNAWKYIAIVKESEVTEQIGVIRYNLFLISLFCFILIIVCSYCFAREFYNPIRKLHEFLKSVNIPDAEKVAESGNELSQISSRIENIIQQLQSVRVQKEMYEKRNDALQRELDKSESLLKQYFIYKIILGDIGDRDEIIRQAEFFEIDHNRKFVVAIAQFEAVNENRIDDMIQEQKSNLIHVFESLLLYNFNPVKIFVVEEENYKRMFALVSFPHTQHVDELMRKLKIQCEFFRNIVHSEFMLECTIGIGNAVDALENIGQSAHEAKNALKYQFIFGNGVICRYEIDKKTNKSLSYFYIKKKFKDKLMQCQNTKDLEKTLRENLEMIRNHDKFLLDYAYYCKDFINTIYDFLVERGLSDQKILQEITECFIHFEQKFTNIDQVIDWAIDYIKRSLYWIEQRKEAADGLIRYALDIIHKRYESDLSLSDVAGELGVSTPYLSKLFREQTGKNFKDYLTMLKMERAKELLENSSLTVTAISQKVGYNNNKQFSKMFKKYTNTTPSEYVRSIKLEELNC